MQNQLDITQTDIFTPIECLGPTKAIEQSLEFFMESIKKIAYMPKDAFKINYSRKL